MSETNKQVNHVYALDYNGCAIACVAMVCGVSYHDARRVMFPRMRVFKDNHTIWGSHKRVVSSIEKLKHSVKQANTYVRKTVPCILSFAWEPKNPRSVCHSVVWDPWRKIMIDPSTSAGIVSHEETSDYVKLWKETNWLVLVVSPR